MSILKRNNDASIYYEVEGSKDATETILFLGGLSRDHTIWHRVIPYFENQYRIILPDNRDAGQSLNFDATYNISDLAEDVADLITGLNYHPVHIVGHSMGGFIAFHLAAKYPELIKTMILCSSAEKQTESGIQYLKNRIRLADKEAAKKPSPNAIQALIQKIYSPKNLTDKDFTSEITHFEMKNFQSQTIDAFKRQAMACVCHDAECLLKDIICPTLIVTGEDDHLFPSNIAHKLSKKIENSWVKVIPSAGHMIQLERPKLFSDFVKNFIATMCNF